MWIIRVMCRLVFAGLVMAALGAVLIYASWKLLHPFLLQSEQGKEIAQLEERVDGLKQDHRRLKDTARRLSTRKGQAEELRRLGYVRPKERIIRFLKGPPGPGPPAAKQPEPAAGTGSLKDRIKQWLRPRLGRAAEG